VITKIIGVALLLYPALGLALPEQAIHTIAELIHLVFQPLLLIIT